MELPSVLRRLAGLNSLFLPGLVLCAGAGAAVPEGFTETVFASGFAAPTAMDFAPDGRLFVCQQAGALRVVKDGVLLPANFLKLNVDSSGERGLLGVAFDPGFPAEPYVYVYYTTAVSPIHNRISRFTADGDIVVPGSELVLMDLETLTSAGNHNGGAIHFGKDGKLYVAVGENATRANSQTLANRLGKMLRINKDGSIPEDNPYYNEATGANRAIWAMGLRNPYTFAIQPGTGRIFINDVGASTWEEINDGLPGSNYGWPATEGETTNAAYVSPLFVYAHGNTSTTGCAISGGAFYNPSVRQFPAEYVGDYFYADYCTAWIRRYDPDSDNSFDFASGYPFGMVDLKVGPDGALYYLTRGGGGVVGRIAYTPGGFTMEDARTAMQAAAGLLTLSSADWNRLNVDKEGESAAVVDLADVAQITRQVGG